MKKRHNYKNWVLVALALYGLFCIGSKIFAIIKEKKRLAVSKTGTLQTV